MSDASARETSAMMTQRDFKYWAFISYSHRDRRWGEWLHRSLETFRVPAQLRSQLPPEVSLPNRLFPVFRDREELPTASDLGGTINDALERSHSLLVICSPDSAKSRWVNEEIMTFKRMGRSNRIFCLIIAGEPNASDDPNRIGDECFPESLRFTLNDEGGLAAIRTEPIAADARPGKDGKQDALLKLVAGVLGVGFDDLKRRDLQRQVRHWIRVSIATMFLLAITVGLTAYAWRARSEALRQELLAEGNFRKAKSAVDRFFIEVSDRDLFETHGLQPLQEKLLRDGLEYYEGFLKDRGSDPTLLLETALTHERIGEMEALIGDPVTALKSYTTSGELLDKLLKDKPNDHQLRLHRAELRDNLSVTLWELKRPAEAIESLKTAQAELTELLRDDPSNSKANHAWKVVMRNLGPFQRHSGQIDDARETYLAAWKVAEAKDTAAVDLASKIQPDLLAAVSAMNIGVLYQEHDHDPGTALTWFLKARDVAESYLKQHEAGDKERTLDRIEIKTCQDLLCSIYSYLGVNYDLMGNQTKAIDATRVAMGYASTLVQRNPTVTAYQEQVANLATNLATYNDKSSDEKSAAESYQAAIEMLARLAANNPMSFKHKFNLAQAHHNFAIHFKNREDTEGAMLHYEKSLNLLEQLHTTNQESVPLVMQLASTNRSLGSTFLSLGDSLKAKQCYEDARSLISGIVETLPTLKRAECLGILESVHERLAAIELALGSKDSSESNKVAALQFNKLALEALEAAITMDPSNTLIARSLAESLNRYGQSLDDRGQLKEAELALLRVHQVYELQGKPNALESFDRTLIAHSYGNLGWVSLRRRDYAASIRYSTMASSFDADQSWIKLNLANAYLCSGNYAEAKAMLVKLKSTSNDPQAFQRSVEAEFKTLRELGIDHPDMERLASDLMSDEDK